MALCHPFLFTILLCLSVPATAQFDFNQLVTDSYKQVFTNQGLSFDELEERSTAKTQGAFVYLSGLKHTIDYFVYGTYDGVLDNLKNNNKRIKQLNPDFGFGKFFLGESYFHLGLIQMAQNNKLGGLISLKKAYAIHLKNTGLPIDFYGGEKTRAVLEIIFNEAKNYSEFAGLVTGVKVNGRNGEKRLQNSVNKGSAYQFEAQLFQTILHQFVTFEEKKANKSIEKILKQYPKSNLVLSLAAVIYSKNNHSEEALTVLSRVDKANPYFIYLQGLNHLQLLQYEKSKRYFEDFLNTNPSYYQTSTFYYLAETYYLTNNQLLQGTIESVHKTLQNDMPADKKAKEKIGTLLSKNKELLKARLLFDGGAFQDGLSVLLKIDKSNLPSDQLIEYYYRIARVYQELNLLDLATSNFLLVVFKSNKDSKTYFAPYSCLQLGIIYLSKNNKTKAQQYIKSGLSYKHYEYKTTVKVQLNKVASVIDEKEITK